MRTLLAVLCLAACSSQQGPTEIVVVVSTVGVDMPRDVDVVQLAARFGGTPMQSSIAERLPMAVTIAPQRIADQTVEIEVRALKDNVVRIDNAATVTFVPGVRQRLDVVLFPKCLGSDCASNVSQRSCTLSGRCVDIVATILVAEPALDGGVTLFDLAPSDLPPPVDLRPQDFGGQPPPCTHNACGGCATLIAQPGSSCGVCHGGTFACFGSDAVICIGPAVGVNGCGGCAAIVPPGSPCGTCKMGVEACNTPDTTVCKNPTAGANACGGCSSLSNQPGDSCGCGGGSFMCSGTDAVVCNNTNLVNACGGCGVLAHPIGSRCNDCGSVWTCGTGGTTQVCPNVCGPGNICCGGTCQPQEMFCFF
jgi:hypothetical protein